MQTIANAVQDYMGPVEGESVLSHVADIRRSDHAQSRPARRTNLDPEVKLCELSLGTATRTSA